MKKITLILCGVVLFAFGGIYTVKSQAVEQGTIIIDPYYGFPLSGKLGMVIFFDAYGATSDLSVSGLGPTGGRLEYMLADRFGIGIDFIYKKLQGEWTNDSLIWGNSYSYVAEIIRTRIHLRFNYHLMASSEDLDLYLGMGVGTNNRKLTLTSVDDKSTLTIDELTLLPFSLRFAFGVRYYFTENIGINTEIGIGGPLVTVGASIKF